MNSKENEAERQEKNCPCNEICPLMKSLELIGGKWKIPILCALAQGGATRYNELKRKVQGITNTMLASSLKELEAAALVTRVQYAEMPVRVEYSVTENAKELIPILGELVEWGKKQCFQDSLQPQASRLPTLK